MPGPIIFLHPDIISSLASSIKNYASNNLPLKSERQTRTVTSILRCLCCEGLYKFVYHFRSTIKTRKRNPLLKLFKIASLLLLNLPSNAQSSIPDSVIFHEAQRNTLQVYHNYLSDQAGLYNGRLYADYRYTISNGIPFLDTTQATPGSVVYNNILYENARLLLDILKQKLLVTTPGSSLLQELSSQRVSRFTLLNHRFINFQGQQKARIMPDGFYEILFEGKKSSLYKRYTKQLVDDLSTQRVIRNVVDKNFYYLQRDDAVYPLTTKKTLLKAYTNHRREVNNYLRKAKMNIRKTEDAKLSALAAFYEDL